MCEIIIPSKYHLIGAFHQKTYRFFPSIDDLTTTGSIYISEGNNSTKDFLEKRKNDIVILKNYKKEKLHRIDFIYRNTKSTFIRYKDIEIHLIDVEEENVNTMFTHCLNTFL